MVYVIDRDAVKIILINKARINLVNDQVDGDN